MVLNPGLSSKRSLSCLSFQNPCLGGSSSNPRTGSQVTSSRERIPLLPMALADSTYLKPTPREYLPCADRSEYHPATGTFPSGGHSARPTHSPGRQLLAHNPGSGSIAQSPVTIPSALLARRNTQVYCRINHHNPLKSKSVCLNGLCNTFITTIKPTCKASQTFLTLWFSCLRLNHYGSSSSGTQLFCAQQGTAWLSIDI